MSKWTLKDACLLDAFGELPPAAHDKLAHKLDENPAFRRMHDELTQGADMLRSVPIHEPSAADRHRIPARIKAALHRSLFEQQREKWTRGVRTLIHRASLAGVCALVLGAAMIYGLPRMGGRAKPRSPVAAAGAPAKAPPAMTPTQNVANSNTAAQPTGDEPFDDYFVADVSDGRDAAPPRNDGSTQPPRPY